MTGVDWLALAIIAALAVLGAQEGLLAGGLSLGGLVGGAVLGGRLAPWLLSHGSRSPYTPVLALAGAVAVALAVQMLGLSIGISLRRNLLRLRPLRSLDTLGGLALGAAAGVVLVWVLGVVALQLPGQTRLRHEALRSAVLRRLNEVVPPRTVLKALARIDPLPTITGPLAPVAPPSPEVLRRPGVRAAAPSVVRIVGTACGLAVEGSGWVVEPGRVVTAAHVVAGEETTRVEPLGSTALLPAHAIAFDPRNDVAILRVRGLRARPLPLVEPREGAAVAVLGYPGDGPFTAAPARIGRTAVVLSNDIYDRAATRRITSLRGRVRHGDSGGPAVDASGAVEATIFAARVGEPGGFGVPASIVRAALARARPRVSTGGCVG